MAKIQNITPEEREQAISTIEKVGEQVTDERIEYYVQIRRNTIEHQEEKVIQVKFNQVSEKDKEYAKKVLAYMGRSKSNRQIVLYSIKHMEALNYIKENNLDIDYTPSIFGEAIRYMEEQNSTTIHHLTAEDLVNCIKDNKDELLNNRKQAEAKQKEKIDEEKKEIYADEGKKAIRLAKIALWLGVILVLAPFFINGFGFGWFWYLVIIGVAFFTFTLFGVDGKSKGEYSDTRAILIGFCVVGCLMYLWGPLNPNYERSGSGGGSDSYGSDKFETRTWKCEKCGYVGTNYYNKETKTITGEMSKVAYGKRVCASCYADYERWKPAVDAARKKFGGI